ncbi:hypothetical protein [Salsipaludibacter albus]|uniref:hypothetical protein n=1 Tax=Salsipaludibacter albus TaxID=2849650 RepID=UPI001EE48E6A|nr:hypothetical protein [Salsipaludibacter albus]MBY5163593.1 hypothetical protein [Salsipaludibacter albus]
MSGGVLATTPRLGDAPGLRGGRHDGAGLLVAGVAAVLGMVAVAAVAAFLVTRSITELNLAVAAATTAMPVSVMVVQGSRRLSHPLFVLTVLMVMGVLGQTVWAQYAPDLAGSSDFLPDLTVGMITLGLVVVAGAVLLLLVGWLWPRRDPAQRFGTRVIRRVARTGLGDPAPRRVVVVVLVACLLSLLFTLLLAERTNSLSVADLLASRKRVVDLGASEFTVLGVHRLGMSVSSAAFLLGWFTLQRWHLSWRSPLAAVTLLSFLLVAYQGYFLSSRTTIMVPVVWALLVWVALRRREPSVKTLVTVFVLGFVAAVALQGVRAANQRGVDLAADPLGLGRSISTAVASGKSLSVGVTGMVVQRVPEQFPYQYGRSMVSWTYAAVPRTLWEDKPPVRLGPQLGAPVFGQSEERRTGVPPGILGELWINFGVLGVGVGALVWGLAIRTIDDWRTERGRAAGIAALCYAIGTTAVVVRLPFSEVTDAVASVLQEGVLVVVLLLLVRADRTDVPTAETTDRPASSTPRRP